MLGPLMLPGGIAFAILVTLFYCGRRLAARYAFNRRLVDLALLAICIFAWIPLCGGVYTLTYPYRYGLFEYGTAEQVSNWRVRRYLPEGARDLTIDEKPTGFRARFAMGSRDFHDWLDQHWDAYGDGSVFAREEWERLGARDREFVAGEFADLNWLLPDDLVEYNGPAARNGAGFTIWYSASEGIGFEQAGYW